MVGQNLTTSCNVCGSTKKKFLINKNGFNIVKCKNCGLVYVDPQPPDDQIEKLYSFEKGYGTWRFDPLESKKKFNKKRKQFEEYIKLIERCKKPGFLLDVGCSSGLFLELARSFSWKCYGVDVNKDTAAIAKQKGFNIVIGNLLSTNFPHETFDVITLWEVLEHVKDPTSTLRHARNLLKNDGYLFISTPNISGFEPKVNYYLMGKTINFWRHPEPPHHLYQFSVLTIQKLLQKTGFKVISVQMKEIPLDYTAPKGRHVKSLMFRVVTKMLYLVGRLLNSQNSMIVVVRAKKIRKTLVYLDIKK
jgi:2-polyprenyl-3-methyl-5-hydroxy-6-metoxy-1,4-benzoquinol methylase